jgi:hypothetical protein
MLAPMGTRRQRARRLRVVPLRGTLEPVTSLLRAVALLGSGACLVVLAPSSVHAQEAPPGVPVDVPPGDEYADTDPSALTDFRSTLDPYGQWVDDPTYGQTWTPDPAAVGSNFAPYDTAGSWDYVDNDYVWVSDYSWGWVPFHYGRWVFAGGRWLWVPGRQYAGAWVDWRVGDDGFLGWSPQAPQYGWFGGGTYTLGLQSPEPWAFVGFGALFGPGVGARASWGDAAVPYLGRSRAYVRAQASPGGMPISSAIPHGPPPSSLGIDVSRIPQVAMGPGELRARQFARPSTAAPLGGHAPAPHVVRSRPPAVRAAPPVMRGGARGRR